MNLETLIEIVKGAIVLGLFYAMLWGLMLIGFGWGG